MQTDEKGACLSYKLTYEPKGLGELNKRTKMVLYRSPEQTAYLLLKFHPSLLLQDFCINFIFKSDMMVL